MYTASDKGLIMNRDLKFNTILILLNIYAAVTDAKPTKNERYQIAELETAGSSYSQYYDWGGNRPGGYSFDVTGNGLLDDPRSNAINGYPDVGINYERDIGYHSFGGFGGYGGNGGNGGLSSYYGYNNPYYQNANHLGFGYYKKFGYGNIYSSGVTPNLVTGYRGYTRR